MPNWTNPKNNWQVNEIVTAQDMNIIGDDLLYLKEREGRAKANFIPTSTNATVSFVTLATLNITSRGGDLLVGFYTSTTHDNGGIGYFDFALDGVRIALDDVNGSLSVKPGGTGSPTSVSMTLLLEDIAPGAHSIALQWRTSTQWLAAGHGQLWAVEV
jgi:hypothetical protein